MTESGTVLPRDAWLQEYYWDLEKTVRHCCRCSTCKWVPSWEIKSARFAKVCPSSNFYLFDAYSCQGRMDVAMALLEGRLSYDNAPGVLDVFGRCNTCGGCDIQCKAGKDMEPLRAILEMRAKLVGEGLLLPQHAPMLESLKKEDNTMMGRKTDRSRWADGLDVRDASTENVEVLFHAGCAMSYEQKLWPAARSAIALLKRAGLDIGILKGAESCCGCRLFDMGYRGEFLKYAESNLDLWRTIRVKTVVTSCADCYYGFKRLYPEIASNAVPEVLHVTEVVARLARDGRLPFTRRLNMKVTYHDPCHMGRRDGDRSYVPGKLVGGIYEPPRDIIRSVPGVELVEMERTREFAWCCGSGGGVREAYPDFSRWTARERVEEAIATGAEALLTACAWCKMNFDDALDNDRDRFRVYDIVEFIQQSIS